MSTIMANRRYSKDHEWVDDATPTRIGISQSAADQLGEIVYVELPEVGATITAGESCGEVESTKSVSELFAPVSGTVVEVNSAVVDDPSLLNQDPYGAGWLITVDVSAEGPLMSAEAYATENGGDVE